jgi:hypothetical protein
MVCSSRPPGSSQTSTTLPRATTARSPRAGHRGVRGWESQATDVAPGAGQLGEQLVAVFHMRVA